MDAETTPTETSQTTETVTTTETSAVNDLGGDTALGASSEGGAVADADAKPEGAADQEAAAEDASKGKEGDDAPVVPEKYELAGTDGAELDPVALEAAEPVFKELGLSNEEAQKLVPVAEKFAESIQTRLNQQILADVQTQRSSWLNEAKGDEEIGGTKWDQSLVTAAKALDQLGFKKGSSFRALLDDSGLGNHPEMIRAWVRVGSALSEDNDFIRGGVATSGARSAAETLYPPKQQ